MNLIESFAYLSARQSSDCPAWNCPVEKLVEFLAQLRDAHGYRMLVDVTAVDDGPGAQPRFTVVYHLLNLDTYAYVRVASPCAGDEGKPTAPSVSDLWPGANWHEREVYDMFGIRFDGHPDMRRILMWEGYPHYPLRKEFPLAGIEMEFHAPDVAERTGVRILPAPMAGGPFVAASEGPMSEKEPQAKDQSWTEWNKKPAGAGKS